MEEKVDKDEESILDAVTMQEVAISMKMEFTYQMSPFTLKTKSGPNSQMKQEEEE